MSTERPTPSRQPEPDGVTDNLKIYLRELTSRPPLEHQEVTELAKRARTGDTQAFTKLVEHHLRSVVYFARRYRGPLEDLIQEGNIGLIEAAKKFDPNRGVEFLTYASWWIKRGIRRAIGDSHVISKPTDAANYRARIRRAEEKLREEDKEPTVTAISEETGIGHDVIEGLARRQPTSLSAISSGDDTDMNPVETIEDPAAPNPAEEAVKDNTRIKVQESIIKVCSPDELTVVEHLFGVNGKPRISAKKIGEMVGVTYQRVYQIRDQVFKKLRAIHRLRELL